MVTVCLRGGVSISALVRQVQLEQSCCQRTFQEPYEGNCQQLYFVSHCIQKVEWNVVHNEHRLWEIRLNVLQLWTRSNQFSRWWFHTFLLPQSLWMRLVPHATACIQGTYVIWSSKEIQWCWGTYRLRGVIKRLVVEWTGMLVEFRHSYDDFDHFNRYGGRLELKLSLYSAIRTRHILQTILATRRNGQYIWVSETSTQQLDQSLRIVPASLLSLFQLFRTITV